MKSSLAFVAAIAGLTASASAQQFELGAGQLEYRIVADRTSVVGLDDDDIRLALQVRYVGGDVRVASLGATHGRIVSNELDASGVLDRPSVRQAPFGTIDFGPTARRGMTASHRELFTGGVTNNNADENGGDPNASSAGNPNNGAGEFRWAPGLAGFGNLFAFDNAATGVGRSDPSGDGELISVGLLDDNNGGGDNTGIEPTDGQDGDTSRWDTIFLFNYTVTNFSYRVFSFDYQPLGSPGNPGTNADTVHWWDSDLGSFRTSNAALGVFRDDLSDSVQVGWPSPGAVGLLGLGGLAASRRRRG